MLKGSIISKSTAENGFILCVYVLSGTTEEIGEYIKIKSAENKVCENDVERDLVYGMPVVKYFHKNEDSVSKTIFVHITADKKISIDARDSSTILDDFRQKVANIENETNK